MARLKIYGIARTRAFRVLWMAEEIGLDYEHIAIETGAAGARQPGYLAVNPNGRLPAIDDDGFVMWESLAINIYLAKKHATGTLYPATPQGEAKVGAVEPVGGQRDRARDQCLVVPRRTAAARRARPEDRRGGIELLAPPFRVLDRALAEQPYLLGGEFTVADLNVAAVALRSIAMDLSATPHYRDWLQRCYDRPAAQKVSRLRREAEAGAAIDTVREAAKRNRL